MRHPEQKAVLKKNNQAEEGSGLQLLRTHKVLFYSYWHPFTLSRGRLAAWSIWPSAVL